MKRIWILISVVALVWILAFTARAVTIDLVPVGNPGNAGELSGEGAGGIGPSRVCGGVDYTYSIGKYEVTAGQYTAFLNAVAKTDTYGLYDPRMAHTDWNYMGCNIQRTGFNGNLSYSVAPDWADRPVNYVSWSDAARFCNWLQNGQPTGLQDRLTTEDGAYSLNGGGSQYWWGEARKAGANWVIPTEDEWYKAAYYRGGSSSAGYWDFATKSDIGPGQDMADVTGNDANYFTSPYIYPIDSDKYTTLVGEFQNSTSPYGTFDQSGNVWEWTEEVIVDSLGILYRNGRGGSFNNDYSYNYSPAYDRTGWNMVLGYKDMGFRVAYVPEPSSIIYLLDLSVVGLVIRTLRRLKSA
jgi:sulfatase modifying factor 1